MKTEIKNFSFVQKLKKNIFLHLTTELSIYYLSYSIYTQEPFDIVNLSSMQDTCHMWTKR